MRIPRFYCPEIEAGQTTIHLPEAVHRHAVQVLRLREGAAIRLFDGRGHEHEATLVSVGRRESVARLDSRLAEEALPPVHITLLQGISRGERMDYAIQKAVELGVQAIIPVLMSRCNVQLGGGRADKRLAHWQGVLISACEQSGRNRMPQLRAPLPLADVLAEADGEVKLLLDPAADQRLRDLAPASRITLLVGPEGGISDEEIDLARQAGFVTVQFGPRILRTETASTAALAAIQALWGDMG